MLTRRKCIAQWLKGKQPAKGSKGVIVSGSCDCFTRKKIGIKQGMSAYAQQHSVRLNADEIILLCSNTQRAFNVSRVPGVHSSRFQLFNTWSSVKVKR